MIDIENEVVTLVYNALQSEGINASVESVTNLNPDKFPTVCVEEIDNYSYGGSADSKSNENHAAVSYEINVFTNDLSGKKQQAKKIIDVIDTKMISKGFSRFSKTTLSLDNGTKYRIVARYRAYVDKSNIIYRR